MSKRASPDARRRAVPAALLAACAGAARAADWGGSIGATSDNLYRGLSLSADRPAWLADLHVGFGSGWTAGASAGGERTRDGARGAQVAAYLDRRWRLDADWSVRIGAARYDWPGSRWRRQLSYDEVSASVGYRGRWSATVALSPDATGVYSLARSRTGFAGWAELALHQPVAGRLAADAGVGYAGRSGIGDYDYAYASAGLSYGIGPAYLFVSRVWAGDTHQRYWWDAGYAGERAPARWVASLIFGF